MDPALQEPGMGHIWHYIPLSTIFPHQSNGDTFKSPHQPISSFQWEESSYSSWQFMVETTTPFKDTSNLALQVLAFHFNSISPREYWTRILQGKFQNVVTYQNQLSRHWELQHSLDNSIGPYRLYSSNMYGIGPSSSIHIPLWEFKAHSSFLNMAIFLLK
ncbi:hypothetical protein O181_032781 [Austropuccinia psidii MF-1]|uniref:Uncharacterized protein n=1 Tax=Austropuccinia psidii MF-1 TaxID=1389203 RepID=A0A9Q3CXG4_9BASI|nr:hypothetical protein [Austropuccinia psidii MF-1]